MGSTGIPRLWRSPNPAPGQNIKEGDNHKGHSTPLLVATGGRTLLLSADANGDTACDPRNGQEIWKVRNTLYSPAPAPVFDQGVAFFITGLRGDLVAVKDGGQGDVTGTNILWKLNAHVSSYSSLLLLDGLIYMAAAESFISCVEAASGQVVWTERIPGNYQASPVYGDGRLYFFNQEGVTTVLKPGRACEILASNTLAGGFMASPAVAGKTFFLRTKTHLYRIESAASEMR